jgi:hypothetical protein
VSVFLVLVVVVNMVIDRPVHVEVRAFEIAGGCMAHGSENATGLGSNTVTRLLAGCVIWKARLE